MASGCATFAAWYWRMTGESGFLARCSPYTTVTVLSKDRLRRGDPPQIEQDQPLRGRVGDGQLREAGDEGDGLRQDEGVGGEGHGHRAEAADFLKGECHVPLQALHWLSALCWIPHNELQAFVLEDRFVVGVIVLECVGPHGGGRARRAES